MRKAIEDALYYYAVPKRGKMTFLRIAYLINKDLQSEGIYDRQKALKMAASEALDGFRDVEEAKEFLNGLGNRVYYTARGYEVNADTLRDAIKRRKKGVK